MVAMGKTAKTLKHYWFLWLTIVIGAAALIIQILSSFCYRIPGADLTHGAILSCPFDNYADPILILLIGWLAALICLTKLIEMFRSLRQGNFGIDILAVIAIISCLCVGEFWAAYLIILMLCTGEALEAMAGQRARRELSALIKRRPQIAHLVNDTTAADIDLARVRVGDALLVKNNEVIPVDGQLLSQTATIDESSLTGEPEPVSKRAGDHLISGTLNQSGAIHMRATANAQNSYYSQIIQLVHEAEAQPSHFVNLANRYAVPFTIISLLIASLAWCLSGDPRRFAEVLVVASPCPLILAAPIAFTSGMSHCSRRGIIVKSGETIERIASADVFAFDKTGTLTTDNVAVDHIHASHGYTDTMIVAIVAAAETVSTHVLARSIIAYARDHHITPAPAHSIRETTGGGVFATIGRRRIVVGNRQFLLNSKIRSLPANLHDQTSILVAVNGRYVGAVFFVDRLRRGTKTIVRQLHRQGVRYVAMLTGDRQATANLIAKQINLDKVYAQLSPTDKVKVLRGFQSDGHRVAMVGDGVNDAPVLATAHVGIAMGAMGSTAAGESADAIITSSLISRVVELRHIAQRTMSVARQSVVAGIIICLALELTALFGFVPALVGALLQELIDLVTIVNALRARH